jgi:hypothetical protein
VRRLAVLMALRDMVVVVAAVLGLVLWAVDGSEFVPNLLGAFS